MELQRYLEDTLVAGQAVWKLHLEVKEALVPAQHRVVGVPIGGLQFSITEIIQVQIRSG
jgi:hypothetical protein